ncbi:unnamed protein product [Owenia fusiformis]|uniref:Uncharacterized protein n=1 Tax=Owenia fusiformis TaxID=6347 RepID=A0A8J1XTA0_OWEFU|nr:unnamed protein product [Owenia fusiformis]
MKPDNEFLELKNKAVTTPAIIGICVGALVVLVSVTICAIKCRRRAAARNVNNRLSEAIKKGLKEGGSLKKSPTLVPSESFPQTSASTPTKTTHLPRQGGPNSRRASPATSPSDPPGKHPGVQSCHLENEQHQTTKKVQLTSPQEEGPPKVDAPTPEKDLNIREKSIDDLKLPQLGTLQFNVGYNKEKGALLVTIHRAEDLPAKDPNTESSDPYVKLQLLPDKKHKVKTRVLRKTLNPVYDEIFTFYGITYAQMSTITLHFVVLSSDRYSRDDIIGEVLYPLDGVDLSEDDISLCKEISPRTSQIQSQSRGEMLVSLCYQPAANRLTVVVLKARNLPKMDVAGLSDPYVKIYLLFNGQRIAKKKTHVKKRTLNPVFNESFLFDVPCNEGLQNISLEFSLLDWDRMTKNEVIGRLEVGSKGQGQESHHWNEVMNCPRKQIAEWHKLKE